MGPTKFALGIAIERNFTKHTVSLNQAAFIDRVVERFSQTGARSVDTPMIAGLTLDTPDKTIPTPPDIVK